jgi:hypothetical protein
MINRARLVQIQMLSVVDRAISLKSVRNVEGYAVYFPVQEKMEALLIVKHPVIWCCSSRSSSKKQPGLGIVAP